MLSFAGKSLYGTGVRIQLSVPLVLMTLGISLTVSACAGTQSSGDSSTPEGTQKEILNDAWDKVSTDGRRSACDQFEADSVGFSSSYFGGSYDYDVVKDFMEDKC
ncbi:hypothetical protein K8Z61_17045 [Nocardioides sp. TRM66260-LWL]|uniref:hypothetical protein n=1 Tax=Nocardioides sp. TRM66260-LWL TaxID=2874478 RepID=UPI001CC568D1|nr:hypothetical protein [Nocardioides sp. TRM66260-LWL]MBZ5736202.1 hypothetical protein [Nocardioides sp. TRM66260-LWL]